MENYIHLGGIALTYLATEAILLDFETDTGSNHTGMVDSAATEKQPDREIIV